jgi:hypothetical protein
MEAGSLTAPVVGGEAGDKGLKKDALGFVSSCVIQLRPVPGLVVRG